MHCSSAVAGRAAALSTGGCSMAGAGLGHRAIWAARRPWRCAVRCGAVQWAGCWVLGVGCWVLRAECCCVAC
jgi:hypothetical protein